MADKFLLPGEQLQTTSRVHFMVFYAPLMCFLASFFLIMINVLYSAVLGMCLLVTATIWTIYALNRFTSSQLLLTNQRLLAKSGFFKARYKGHFLYEIEYVDAKPKLFAEYGKIMIKIKGGKEYILKPYTNVNAFMTTVAQYLEVGQ